MWLWNKLGVPLGWEMSCYFFYAILCLIENEITLAEYCLTTRMLFV